jgi:hypothetical protein
VDLVQILLRRSKQSISADEVRLAYSSAGAASISEAVLFGQWRLILFRSYE